MSLREQAEEQQGYKATKYKLTQEKTEESRLGP